MIDITTNKIRLELKARLENKTSLSLRQMAQRCGIDPSHLSKFIQGKKKFSSGKLLAIAETLKLSGDLRMDLISKLDLPKEKDEVDFKDNELFSDWYFYPLIELIRVNKRISSFALTAKAFKISETELSLALEKLLGAGIVKKNSLGKMTVDFKIGNTFFNKTSETQKRNQINIAQLSVAAIKNCQLERRHHAATSLGFDVTQLPLIRLEIKKFQNRLCRIADKRRKLNAIYQMQIGFFPLLSL